MKVLSPIRTCRDERVWPDPDSFDPTRFLDESGGVDRQIQEQLIPFGIGK